MKNKVTTKFKQFVPNDVPSQCFEFVDRENPTIVQIGANDGIVGEEYGFHEFLFELNSFEVHMVEPLEKYHQMLPSTYDRFSGENKSIKYHNYAISEVEGVMQMLDLGGCSHAVSDGGIPVVSKTWKNLVDENQINKIDLLLIDCEGFEFQILKQIFETHQVFPKVIRYEYAHIPNKEETDQYLREAGYDINYCETDPPFNKIAVRT
jgi:FkbM family methyltransferase